MIFILFSSSPRRPIAPPQRTATLYPFHPNARVCCRRYEGRASAGGGRCSTRRRQLALLQALPSCCGTDDTPSYELCPALRRRRRGEWSAGGAATDAATGVARGCDRQREMLEPAGGSAGAGGGGCCDGVAPPAAVVLSVNLAQDGAVGGCCNRRPRLLEPTTTIAGTGAAGVAGVRPRVRRCYSRMLQPATAFAGTGDRDCWNRPPLSATTGDAGAAECCNPPQLLEPTSSSTATMGTACQDTGTLFFAATREGKATTCVA